MGAQNDGHVPVYSVVMRVFVILPAAGIGTRMAAGSHAVAPKQFLTVGGVPVLVRSVKAFLDVLPTIEDTRQPHCKMVLININPADLRQYQQLYHAHA